MWLPLLPALVATHHVRMIDAVGDLNKGVATHVLSSRSRVVGWLDEVVGALGLTAHWCCRCIDRVVDGDRVRQHAPRTGGAARLVCPGRHRVPSISSVDPVGDDASSRSAHAEKLARGSTTRWRWPSPGHACTSPPGGSSPSNSRPASRAPAPASTRRNPSCARPARWPHHTSRSSSSSARRNLHDGRMAARFRERLPLARVELVPRANHLVFIDQQEQVASLLWRSSRTTSPAR